MCGAPGCILHAHHEEDHTDGERTWARSTTRRGTTNRDDRGNAAATSAIEDGYLYTLKLDTVDRESAHFAAAGGFRLTMHRGEWMERGRPAAIWITVQEALSAP